MTHLGLPNCPSRKTQIVCHNFLRASEAPRRVRDPPGGPIETIWAFKVMGLGEFGAPCSENASQKRRFELKKCVWTHSFGWLERKMRPRKWFRTFLKHKNQLLTIASGHNSNGFELEGQMKKMC